jgi:hypothetical protein
MLYRRTAENADMLFGVILHVEMHHSRRAHRNMAESKPATQAHTMLQRRAPNTGMLAYN